MAEKSNFFDSVRGDRAYYAADFAKKFATFFLMVFLITVYKLYQIMI